MDTLASSLETIHEQSALLSLTLLFALLCCVAGLGAATNLMRAWLEKQPARLSVFGGVIAFIVGLRLASFVAQLLAAANLSLDRIVWCLAVAGLVSGLSFGLRGRLHSSGRIPAAIILVFALLSLITVYAPPTAWDSFSHWLLLPHEMLRQNDFLSLNQATNSVAPNYALHQCLLAVAALFFSVPDGHLNALIPVFLGMATLAVDVALREWGLEPRPRLLAAVFNFVLLTTSDLIFGFFYGDALLILTLALAGVGVARAIRANSWSQCVLNAVLLSSPLIAKGYGYLIALTTSAMLLALHLSAPKTAPLRTQKTLLKTAGFSTLLVLIEHHLIDALTLRIGESNLNISLSDVGGVSGLLTLPHFASTVTLLFRWRWQHGLYFLSAVMLGFFVVDLLRRLRTPQMPSAVDAFRTVGLCTFAMIFAGTFVRPDISPSLSRYSFALVPFLTVDLVASASRTPYRWIRRSISIIIPTIITVALWKGDLFDYAVQNAPRSPTRLIEPSGSDRESKRFRPPLLALAKQHPEFTQRSRKYVLLTEKFDHYLAFRLLIHFVETGYEGHVITGAQTSRDPTLDAVATEARAALLAHDAPKLERILTDVDVVVLVTSDATLGDMDRAVMSKTDVVALARQRLPTIPEPTPPK